MNKIELVDVTKKRELFTLGEVSFGIPKGFITGFVGKNGAGKTTTIKEILSLITRDGGEILFEGQPIHSLDYLQEIGVIMDTSMLGKDWNMKMVNRVMKVGYHQWNSQQFFDYLQRFDIRVDKKVKELSRGMQIKLMLSIALSHGANTLILDEPTSGLDPSMRNDFVEILQQFIEDENHTILFSTHITKDLDDIGDYITFIDQGQIISSGAKEDFVGRYSILKGDVALLDTINPQWILGKKVTDFGFEILVHQKDMHKIEGNVVEERPTIEQILVLYGRN